MSHKFPFIIAFLFFIVMAPCVDAYGVEKFPQDSEEVFFIAVGDIMLSRNVAQKIKNRDDINYPFLKMKDYLQEGDIVFGNLESPITPGREISDHEMLFRANPGIEQALKNAGFTLLSLANNHTMNFGAKGLINTFRYLQGAGIQFVGAGKNTEEASQPVFIKAKGLTFAFLAYDDKSFTPPEYEAGAAGPGIAFMDISQMASAVKKAKQKADFVIVLMHAGKEYTAVPNKWQKQFARSALEAGAETVIGSHPHVVQSLEEYKGKYIFYSLGNFVFDQMWSQNTKQGLAVKLIFNKNGISAFYFLPVLIQDFSQPQTLAGKEAEKILARLKFPFSQIPAFIWNKEKNTFEQSVRYGIVKNKAPLFYNVSKTQTADLDKNSLKEEYALANGQLKITENSQVIWASLPDWRVDNFVLADSNNDGILDLNLSVWKPGSFGSSKPFWIKQNDQSVKNHFFIYNLANGKVKPIWQSSNLDAPNCAFKIADADDDNKNDLVVIEGNYADSQVCRGEYLAVWKWNGWGFTNEWRSKKGEYQGLDVEKIEGKTYLVAR